MFDHLRFRPFGRDAGASGVLFRRNFASALSLGADATFTRSTTATVTDFDGLVKNCVAGEARIPGARRVWNIAEQSENIPDAAWSVGGSAVKTTNGTSFSGTSLDQLSQLSNNLAFPNMSTANAVITVSVTVSVTSGTAQFRIKNTQSGVADHFSPNFTATTTPQRFSFTKAYSSSAGNGLVNAGISNTVSAPNSATFIVTGLQIEIVTGQANQNPSEYVSVGVLSAPYHGANVDGVKYFATENGNTVDANGVVTEAAGSAISGIGGLLLEPQRSNYANNSDDLSGGADTIDLTAGGTGDYTLSVSGDAAVTVAAGTATGTGFGQATVGSDVTFNLSAVGTVTLTLDSGSFDTVNGLADYQVEKGSVATTWIPNSTAATTRNADALSYSGIPASNETRAVVDGANADADDWDGVVDATLLGADNVGVVASITAYKPGMRPA